VSPGTSVSSFLFFVKAQGAAAHPDKVPRAERDAAIDLLVVDKRITGSSAADEEVSTVIHDNVGVQLFYSCIAEQREVNPFGSADARLFLGQNHLPPGSKASLHLDPRFLQDHLGQAYQQADTHSQSNKSHCRWAPEPIFPLWFDLSPNDPQNHCQNTAQHAP